MVSVGHAFLEKALRPPNTIATPAGRKVDPNFSTNSNKKSSLVVWVKFEGEWIVIHLIYTWVLDILFGYKL